MDAAGDDDGNRQHSQRPQPENPMSIRRNKKMKGSGSGSEPAVVAAEGEDDTMENEWKCEECGKEFLSIRDFCRHMRPYPGCNPPATTTAAGCGFGRETADMEEVAVESIVGISSPKLDDKNDKGKEEEEEEEKETEIVPVRSPPPAPPERWPDSRPEYKCFLCPRVFSSLQTLGSHRRLHLYDTTQDFGKATSVAASAASSSSHQAGSGFSGEKETEIVPFRPSTSASPERSPPEYKCYLCPMVFSSRKLLEKHSRIHYYNTTEDVGKAASVSASATSSSSQQAGCGFSIEKQTEIVAVRSLNPAPPERSPPEYSCCFCPRVFSSYGSLEKHCDVHLLGKAASVAASATSSSSQQARCGFRREKQMQIVIFRSLSPPPPQRSPSERSLPEISLPEYRCCWCPRVFLSLRSLEKHSKVHLYDTTQDVGNAASVVASATFSSSRQAGCGFSKDKETEIMPFPSPTSASPEVSLPRYSCCWCPRVFFSLRSLENHSKAHLYDTTQDVGNAASVAASAISSSFQRTGREFRREQAIRGEGWPLSITTHGSVGSLYSPGTMFPSLPMTQQMQHHRQGIIPPAGCEFSREQAVRGEGSPSCITPHGAVGSLYSPGTLPPSLPMMQQMQHHREGIIPPYQFQQFPGVSDINRALFGDYRAVWERHRQRQAAAGVRNAAPYPIANLLHVICPSSGNYNRNNINNDTEININNEANHGRRLRVEMASSSTNEPLGGGESRKKRPSLEFLPSDANPPPADEEEGVGLSSSSSSTSPPPRSPSPTSPPSQMDLEVRLRK